MKAFRLAVVMVLLAAPATAQTLPNINLLQEGPSKTDEEKAADAERDAKYKETLKKIPDAKVSNDPWGGMRADPAKSAPKAPASKASASAKKSRTGPSAN